MSKTNKQNVSDKMPKKKVISQKDYLKKYLSGEKKKKEKTKIQRRVQIIDDNIDCVENNDIYNDNNTVGFDPVDEFAPQIVGVVDERPQDVKTLDMYKNKNRWKRVGGDSDNEDSSVINVDQVKNYVQQINSSTLKDLIKKNDKEEIMENGVPIRRDRKTFKKRNLIQEKEEEQKKEELLKQHKEKYAIWGKGIKQVKDAQEQYKDDLHEMQKPFARYAGDQDLEEMLKSRIRDGDPMLQYITGNREDDSPDGVKHKLPEFRGVCPPNRFNIRPGHRWDGVNRSNGYEEKLLLQINSKKALESEAYKWSSSDM